MDYEKRVNNILIDNETYMLKCMLEDCDDEAKSNLITNVLNFIHHKNNQVKKKKNITSDIGERLAKIDDYLYRRPWNKLDQIHKKNRLENYFENYLFDAPKENIKSIKSKIMKDFNDKKLNTSKGVNYDPISSTIIGITNLNYDNELCEYSYPN